MKAVVVIQIVVVCLVLTLTSIFTVNSGMVRKAELSSIVAVDVENIVKDYFDGKIETANLEGVLIENISEAGHSKIVDLKVTIFCADAEKDIVDVLIEETYVQPNGRPKLVSTRRVYIREVPADSNAVEQYSFVRCISAERFKKEDGTFVEESQGGVKSDSIWRTDDYSAVLENTLMAEK